MIQDIKPYKGIQLVFMRDIEPRRLELAEHMGILTRIKVKDAHEPYKHEFEAGHNPDSCYCVDCAGDFSGASEDEVWGGR